MKPRTKGAPPNDTLALHLKFARPDRDEKPIYYIGPFGTRVSFASQQRRALAIVGSLLQLGEISKQTEIAVVGAGIAGLTAFVALSLMGAKVTLYEKEAAVLTLQASSTHRYIHPSVNFWPGQDVKRTTDFPFFDWYSSICSKVIETFLFQWEGDPSQNPARRDPEQEPVLRDKTERDPVFECELRLEKYDKAERKIHLVEKANDRHPGRGRRRFTANVVLVAMGFGVEDNLEDQDQRPYWGTDHIPEYVARGGNDILISGAGDGGLMDCLRLVYRGFKNGDLALDLIKALETGSYSVREKMQEIEAAALQERDPNLRASQLAAAYEDFFSNGLNRAAKRVLDAALVRPETQERPNSIRLVGMFEAPYELGAAPINRFMAAYALKARAFAFVRGKLTRSADVFLLDEGAGPIPIGSQTKVIVRHGPKHALAGFLTEKQCRALKEAQQRPGAFASGEGQFDNEFFLEGSTYPSLVSDPEGFAGTRHRAAWNFVMERYSGVVRLDIEYHRKPRYLVEGRAFTPGGSPEQIGEVPRTLYGVPVVHALRHVGPSGWPIEAET